MIVKLTEIKKIKHMTKAMLFKIDEATKIDIRPQVFKIKTKHFFNKQKRACIY